MVPFVAPEALERRLGVRFRLRLGANESVFGPSPKAIEAMRERAAQAAHYGDPQSLELREALAGLHGCRIENVLVASGIDEILALTARLFVNPGDRVVTTLGSYPTFDLGAYGAGAEIRRVPYRNDAPDLEALAEEAISADAKLVYLANPDNPSGAYHDAASVTEFRARLPEGCVLLLDEAYADFVPPAALPSLPIDDPGVIRARTFSKAHGMAGMRIGYALTASEPIAAFDKVRLHFGVNGVAQAGALASLSDPEYLASVVEETAKGRGRLCEIGTSVGLKPLPSATNFVLFDAGSKERADFLLDALLNVGVFVRKPGIGALARCLRITVGRSEDLALLQTILQHTSGV